MVCYLLITKAAFLLLLFLSGESIVSIVEKNSSNAYLQWIFQVKKVQRSYKLADHSVFPVSMSFA